VPVLPASTRGRSQLSWFSTSVTVVGVDQVAAGALEGILLAAAIFVTIGSFEAVAPLPDAIGGDLHTPGQTTIEAVAGGLGVPAGNLLKAFPVIAEERGLVLAFVRVRTRLGFEMQVIGDSTAKVDSGSQLVARAGTTMDEIVQAVRRVTDIMGEISAASDEQSQGIEQVSRAVGQMDEVTQQNAALVEEAAAAAASLEEQTRKLKDVVGHWQVSADTALHERVEPSVGKSTNATRAIAPIKVVSRPNVAANRAVNRVDAKVNAAASAFENAAPTLRSPKLAAAAAGDWETF